MFNKEELLQFLLEARTKTYAGAGGDVEPTLKDSKQLEYKKDEWFYRDVFYVGAGLFMGVETIYFKNDAIWAMSYYGNFKGMSEDEIDSILRKALLENWQTARTWQEVRWEKDGFKYICEPDFEGSIEELAGNEKILKEEKEVYHFFYAGGLIK